MYHDLSSIRTICLAMEFAIPISRFNPAHVKWGQPKTCLYRRTIPFEYEEPGIKTNNLIVSLYPLRVVEIDMEKKQIVLEETKRLPFLSKLEQLQHNISDELINNSKKWVDESKLPALIQSPLQPWLKSRKLILYLSSDPSSLAFFMDSGPTTFSTEHIKPGDTLRAIIKIHGLSLQMSEQDIWTGKSRIQHNILQIYKLSSPLV